MHLPYGRWQMQGAGAVLGAGSIVPLISLIGFDNWFDIDSNGIVHSFSESPSRIALTNTYAASVMRMLDVNLSVVVGVSGDFQDEDLWPEFTDTPIPPSITNYPVRIRVHKSWYEIRQSAAPTI